MSFYNCRFCCVIAVSQKLFSCTFSFRYVIPLSSTLLDNRRRNGQRHLTTQVLSYCKTSTWKYCVSLGLQGKRRKKKSVCVYVCVCVCVGAWWRAVEAGRCCWRSRLSGLSWRAQTMFWISCQTWSFLLTSLNTAATSSSLHRNQPECGPMPACETHTHTYTHTHIQKDKIVTVKVQVVGSN